jgi:glutathione synthase/RimK-type ligase-like ATP-grasp enzyme
LRSKLNKLALKAANAIGIKFCSVDIVQAKNQLMILEINSGLMFEKYSQNNKRKLIIAKIYTQIIDYMFSKNNLVN